jgi:hypothetical protein
MRHRPTPCNHCGNHTRQNSPRADATQNGQHPIHIHTHLHLVGILPSHSTPQPEPFTQTHGKNLAHYTPWWFTAHPIHCTPHGGALATVYTAPYPRPQTSYSPGSNAGIAAPLPHTAGRRNRGPSPGTTVYNTPPPCHRASNVCCDRTGLRPLSQDKGTPESTLMSP